MLYSLPFISALIGWVTNYLAIKMLFHPRIEKNILGIKVQGIFPKRQNMLAERIGKLVGEQLFTFDDIKDKMLNPKNMGAVHEVLDKKVETFLREKLATVMPMIAMFINDSVVEKIKTVLVEELQNTLPEVIETFAHKIGEEVDISKIVEEKVAAFSIDKLEEILFAIMSKEFKFIELVGAVLGFIIGCVQLALISFQ